MPMEAVSRPFFVQGVAGGVAGVLEGAVAFVDVEVVGVESLATSRSGLPSLLTSTKSGGEAVVAVLVGDAGLHADIGEGAVAVVVEEVIGFALAGRAGRT